MAHKNIDVEKLLGLFTVNPNDARGKIFIASAINDELKTEFDNAENWRGGETTKRNELEDFRNSSFAYLFLINKNIFKPKILEESVNYLFKKVKKDLRDKIIESLEFYADLINVKIGGKSTETLKNLKEQRNVSESEIITVRVGAIPIPTVFEALIDAIKTFEALERVQEKIKKNPITRKSPFNLNGDIMFNYRISRFWLKKIFGSDLGSTGITEEEIMAELVDTDSGISKGSRYTWRDGKLFDKKKGVDVEADAKTKSHDDACFDFGLAKDLGGRADLCLHLIRDCIKGHNVDKCKKLLTTANFWEFDKDEFKNMNIGLAKKLLDAFQFKDTNGVYESSTKWIERISEWKSKYNLESADIDKVRENINLTSFLDRVVEELNSNTVVSNNPGSSTLKDNKLWGWGILPKVHQSGVSLDEINRLIKSNRARVRSFFINPMGMAPMMIGGGDDSMSSYALRSAQIKKEFRSSFDQLDSMKKQFLQVIEAHDHKIDNEEVNAINRLYKRLSKDTNTFLKYLSYMEKYAVLHSFYAEHDPDKVIDITGMKAFVEKRDSKFNELEKVEDNVMEVLKALQNAVEKLKR